MLFISLRCVSCVHFSNASGVLWLLGRDSLGWRFDLYSDDFV
jgi:hypothetical protein